MCVKETHLSTLVIRSHYDLPQNNDDAAFQRLVVFRSGCVRGICGVHRRKVRDGRIAAIELLRRIRLQPIEYYFRRRQLRWL